MSLFRIPTPFLALAALTFVSGLAAPAPALAVQGQGTLSQAPLVSDLQITPNFIMAVDDSGSMTFETLSPGQDGQYCTGTGTTNIYFDGSNALRAAVGSNGECAYHHLMPWVASGVRIHHIANRFAVPPIDLYGFSRSPTYNPQYFNPLTTYDPWIDSSLNAFPAASTTATRAYPEVAGTAQFNMTVDRFDRSDAEAEDGTFDTAYDSAQTYGSGTEFPAGIQVRRNGACGGLPNTGTGYQTLASTIVTNASCNNVYIRRPRTGTPVTDELFRVPSGTILPIGTTYYRLGDSACGGVALNRPTQRMWVTLTAPVTIPNNASNDGNGANGTENYCDLGIKYFPATFFLPQSTPNPAGFGFTGANRIAAPDACGDNCDMWKYEIKPANFAVAAKYNEAIQNFANWFSFYGNRNRAMIAGLTRSLSAVNNMNVGYFTINNRNTVTMRPMNDTAQKSALYTEMLQLDAGSSTPNRFAVDHLGTQYMRTDAGAPITLSCQKNSGMLFTDGYSNQGSVTTAGNADSGMGSPLADAHSNTLADIAAKYYTTNLRPDLAVGKVKTISPCSASNIYNDCNQNLHMNFFGITLGAKGDIYGVNAAMTNDPVANPPPWQAYQNDDPSTVDEIWHATLNARGKFVNAQTPSAITTAMQDILDSVADAASPAGTFAINGARIGTSSQSVSPMYGVAQQGTDWYGDLTAQSLAVTSAGAVTFTTQWTASAALPAHGARTILFASPSTSVNPTVALFAAGNLGTAAPLCNAADPLRFCNAADIGPSPALLDVSLVQAVNYLRGDSTFEGTKLRDRTTALGDIVNSTPVITAPTDDYGYRTLRGATAYDYDPWAYQAYLTTKAGRDRMVYVGANDGMLHAFHGATGVERFAFIPSTSLGHLGNLLYPAVGGNDQRFQHRYYVDGPVTVSDARIGSNWRTMLVATGGSGGRGLFALDVSSPGTFTSTNVMWELSPTTATYGPHVGNMLGKPAIVPTRSGTAAPVWKVVVGNGYSSDNGGADSVASLFVIDAGTGAVTRIPAIEAGGPAMDNGLGPVVVIDRWISNTTTAGRDGYGDTAYAGDLHGNIWKFDLRNNTLANGGVPIFTASVGGVRQPITGGIEVATGPGGGALLYFGTGSYWFDNDRTDRAVQTVYSVLDNGTSGTATRANLSSQVMQTIDHDANAATPVIRSLINSTVNYVTQRGWYMDLFVTAGNNNTGAAQLAGERFVGNPRLQSGNVLFVTFEPAGGVAADPCLTSGTNWLYVLNSTSAAAAMSGLRIGSPTGAGAPTGQAGVALNTTGDGPVMDIGIMVVPPPGALSPTATAAEILEAQNRSPCDLVINTSGGQPMYLPRACGRQSWRQIR